MATLTTQGGGIPYPNDNEYLKDVPDHIRGLAEYIDLKIINSYANATDRNTKVPSPVEGMLCWMRDADALVVFDGTTWKQVYPAVPKVTSSNAAPTGTAAAGDIHVQF